MFKTFYSMNTENFWRTLRGKKNIKPKGRIKMLKNIVWYQLYVEIKKYKLENITTVKQNRIVAVDNYPN